MEDPDVCIIGGGPAGCLVASLLAKKHITVGLFEQKKHIGLPVQCAGLVTPRVFDLLPFSTKGIVQTTLKGARIHSPSGKSLIIGGNKIHAYSIDRTKFDQSLMKEAEKNGSDIHLRQRIVSVQKQTQHIELVTSTKQSIITPLVIGADGPYSKIRDVCDFPQPKEFLRGIGATITGTSLDSEFVEIFVGNTIAPGFFAWMIPTTKDGTEAKIGLCISPQASQPPLYYFEKLLDHPAALPYIKKGKIIKKIAGIIPLGPLKRSVDDHLMLVGDAAAQVKPTSGGGLYPGLLSARYCANTAEQAIQTQQFSEKILQTYHESWSKDIGRELRMGMQFRKIFTALTDDQLDHYVEKFKEKNIEEIITTYGDMDYPSTLAKPVLKKMPSLLKLFPKIIK